jgi:hypothetical protein
MDQVNQEKLKIQEDCINTLNRAIQEFGGEGDSKFPLKPEQPQPQPQPQEFPLNFQVPNTPGLFNPLGQRGNLQPPPSVGVPSSSESLEDSSKIVKPPKVIVNVSNTCLETKKFRAYVLKILNSLVNQLPDITLFSRVKRFLGFTTQLSEQASQELEKYTTFKVYLKNQVTEVKEKALPQIQIKTKKNKKNACTTYEVLKYMEENKRKITSKNMMRILYAFMTAIIDSSSKDPKNILETMEDISVKYLQDLLSRQELPTNTFQKLNDIRALSKKDAIKEEPIGPPERRTAFDALAEGMRALARRTRRKKGRVNSRRRSRKRGTSRGRKNH